MRSIAKSFLSLLASAAVIASLSSCEDADELFTVRRASVDVGMADVGDSVSASFTFKNNSSKEMTLNFIPECDCTTVNLDYMKLEPRKSGRLDVKVAVESQGEFVKYVFVQAAGSEEFLTVSVKGHTK